MRPKLLQIEGLQSFRERQAIDFDVLGETGLFGIFGPTGSGKSTVLDAITFALYGKVKRAERGTQGIINANLNETRVSFTFELQKGSLRKTYRVEREYKRKKNSPNSCVPKVARLIEVTDAGEIPICDKASEVSSSIEELLGLSHDDFTRAVVLPQNSFQEFLFLDNAKKREMLERIFYLEDYGKNLAEKLNRKISVLTSQKDRLSGELAAYGDATDGALEKARAAAAAARAERVQAERELKELEKKYDEAREVWQLVQELAVVEERERLHLAAKEDIEAKKDLLSRAEKAEGLQKIIATRKDLFQKLQEADNQLQKLLAKLPSVSSELNESKEQLEAVRKEAETQRPKLLIQKTRLEDALQEKEGIQTFKRTGEKLRGNMAKLEEQISLKQRIISEQTKLLSSVEEKIHNLRSDMERLKTDPDYRQKLEQGKKLEDDTIFLKTRVDAKNAEVEQLREAVAKLEERLAHARESLNIIQKQWESAEGERLAHERAKPGDRDSLLSESQAIFGLERVWDLLNLRQREMSAVQNKLDGYRKELAAALDRKAALAEEKQQAEAYCQQCGVELEQVQKTMERHSAYLLSKTLREGEPCPVCGSQHHPHPAAQEEAESTSLLEQQLERAKKQFAAAEKALKEAENRFLAAREKALALKEQVNELEQELQQQREDYKEVQRQLPVEFQFLKLELLNREIKRKKAANLGLLEAVDAWEKTRENFGTRLKEVNEQLSQQKLEEKGLAAELKVNRDNLAQGSKSLGEALKLYQEKLQEYTSCLGQMGIREVTEELARLSDNDRRRRILEKELEKAQEDKRTQQSLLEQVKEDLQGLNTQRVKVETEYTGLLRQIESKERKVKDLVGDADIQKKIKEVEARLEAYSALENEYRDKIGKLENQHNALTNRKSMLENQKTIYGGELAKAEENLKAAMLEKGFTDVEEVEKSLIPKDRQKALGEEIGSYQQREIEINSQKAVLRNKLGSRCIGEEEWLELSRGYQETAALKDECVSRSRVAENSYHTLKARHERWRALTEAYSKLSHRCGLFEQILKLLKGERGKDNSFIDFIAEERLRYVAAKASETLGVMTQYKYGLELDADSGFVIRDNANGGVCRMATSLSGGETFLTSLALALALSEQIQLKGQSPLEFFFLDEGFGTLDNNLLDAVMDSLERLSSHDRVIGLISHVPELRERMARRLMVAPPSADGSGSRVKIEIA